MRNSIFLLLLVFSSCVEHEKKQSPFIPAMGTVLDSLDGVYVHYNGNVSNVVERNVSADGYNLGLKYQCVEFVKRYYYSHYRHKMPNTYGHAKDFFNAAVGDGKLNTERGLVQYKNPSAVAPKKGDLLVMQGHSGNPYGHVAIVSRVGENQIEIIQQNPGPFAPSRVTFNLIKKNDCFFIKHTRILGWLRKP